MKSQSVKYKILRSIRLRRAINLVRKSTPGLTVANTILVILQGLLPLVTLYLMKLIIDEVTTAISAPEKIDAFSKVLFYVAVAGGITLIGALLNSAAALVREAQSMIVQDHLQNRIQAKSINVDLAFFENPKYFDTFHRAQGQGSRAISIVNGLAAIGQSTISLIAMIGLLLTFHWIFALILFSAVIPGVIVRLKYADKLYFWQRKRTVEERKAAYFNWIITGNHHAKEMRLFNLGNIFRRKYIDLRKVIRREKLDISVKHSIAAYLAQIFATLATYGSYAFFAYRTIHGAITLGDLVMYHQAFQRGQEFLRNMLGGFAGLYEDNLFLSNLYEFLDLKPQIVEPNHPKSIANPFKMGIKFEDVSFRYPGGKHNVLENITLKIDPGEVVAIVGENGSGKTTLVKLLCRLYDPGKGLISIDDTDLRQFSTLDLRREIGVIFQDYVTYYTTARENIWFGNIDIDSDNERIIKAAKLSGAANVIDGLPNKYDTILGKWFEDGEELSIGEWQKIALARAFLGDSQILVLDEPTSAMDARAEANVFVKFRELIVGKTAILISHRFSTVRWADRIVVLEKGKLIETGTHQELIRLESKYFQMYEAQASMYR